MTRFMMTTTAAILLSCSSAIAQVGGMSLSPAPSPLGMTSPLGIGPGSPVAPAGIPLGATELASPGVSPMPSGVSPMGPTGSTNGSVTTCGGIGASMPQTSFGIGSGVGTSTAGTAGATSVFDGGGMAGTASGTCATIGSNPLAGPAASASSPSGMGSGSSVGRVGIPLGSTELGAGGLSPPPVILTPNPPAPVSTFGTTAPCPMTGMSPTTGMSTSSGSC